MLKVNEQSYDSDSLKKQVIVLDTFETNDNTPRVIYSIPVSLNNILAAKVDFFVFNMNFTNGAFGTVRGMLLAGTTPVIVGTDISAINNFITPVPTLTFVGNVANKTIDVTIMGKSAMTLHWHLELTIFRNT